MNAIDMWAHPLLRSFIVVYIYKKTCWIICDNLCLAITCRHSRDSLRSGGLDRH